jgi:hypothetical protein
VGVVRPDEQLGQTIAVQVADEQQRVPKVLEALRRSVQRELAPAAPRTQVHSATPILAVVQLAPRNHEIGSAVGIQVRDGDGARAPAPGNFEAVQQLTGAPRAQFHVRSVRLALDDGGEQVGAAIAVHVAHRARDRHEAPRNRVQQVPS